MVDFRRIYVCLWLYSGNPYPFSNKGCVVLCFSYGRIRLGGFKIAMLCRFVYHPRMVLNEFLMLQSIVDGFSGIHFSTSYF